MGDHGCTLSARNESPAAEDRAKNTWDSVVNSSSGALLDQRHFASSGDPPLPAAAERADVDVDLSAVFVRLVRDPPPVRRERRKYFSRRRGEEERRLPVEPIDGVVSPSIGRIITSQLFGLPMFLPNARNFPRTKGIRTLDHRAVGQPHGLTSAVSVHPGQIGDAGIGAIHEKTMRRPSGVHTGTASFPPPKVTCVIVSRAHS